MLGGRVVAFWRKKRGRPRNPEGNFPQSATAVNLLVAMIEGLPKPTPFLALVGSNEIRFRPHTPFDDFNTIWEFDSAEDSWSRHRGGYLVGPFAGSLTPFLVPFIMADFASYQSSLVAVFLHGMSSKDRDDERAQWISIQPGAAPLFYRNSADEAARIWVSDRMDAWHYSAMYLHRVAKDSDGTELQALGEICAAFLPHIRSNQQELGVLGVEGYLSGVSVEDDWSAIGQYLDAWEQGWKADGKA